MQQTTSVDTGFKPGVITSALQKTHFITLIKAAAWTALLTSATSSIANDEQTSVDTALEIITVTAEKREGNLLDIASSISARSVAYLEDAEITDMTEFAQHIPNLHIFSWGGRRDTNVFIRGIGPGLFTDPTVGFYVDGINYSNNGSFDLDLMDIQHIEVLRGPQGTLYGGNSLSGVINIVTRQPDDVTEGKISLSVDNLSQRTLLGAFSTPLSDSVFFNAALSVRNADGYIDNLHNGERFGEKDDVSSRIKLRWLASDQLDTLLTVDYQRFRGDSYAMGPHQAIIKYPQQIKHDFSGDDNRDSLGIAMNMNWRGENVDITSITSWREWENFNSADQDGMNMPGLVMHSRSDETHHQLSQEIRWTSKSTKQLNWIAGLYAYTAEFDATSLNTQDFTAFGQGGPVDSPASTTRDDSGYAAFGQIDYALTDAFTLTAGLRYDHQAREAFVDLAPGVKDASKKFRGDKKFHEVLPKLALSYSTEANALIYASISAGYRAGGFDTLYPNLSNPTYDSESSTNYELGYKSRLFNDAMEINAALFLIEIEDMQVQQLLPASGQIITDNAAESRSKGFEFESRYTPADGWLLSFSGSYTDAEYKDYTGLNFATFAVENYSGNALPNTPKWTANFSIQNRYPLSHFSVRGQWEWLTQLDSQFVDAYYFGAQNQLQQNAYKLLNFKTGIETENWQAYLWVKNALDEYYSKIEFNFGLGRTTEAAPPRSVGLTVRYHF